MTKCGGCHGTGKVRCTSCHGRGYISRLNSRGEMEMSPCIVCGGKGRMRHDFCHGRGDIDTGKASRRPTPRGPRKSRKGQDALAGNWVSSRGNRYEMVKQGKTYRVTEQGLIGQTASGTATLAKNTVTLEMTNVLLGPYTVQLRLEGDTLTGTLNVMGVPTPMILTRD